MTDETIHQSFTVRFSYPVMFTRDLFMPEHRALADLIRSGGRERNRVLFVIDSGVIAAAPGLTERIRRYCLHHTPLIEPVAQPFVIRGGEACKNEPFEVEKLQSLAERHALCRHSFIIAIGGGAVLDAVGYAATTTHRGVRLIRVPTTVLAQNDAGVGVKNGVNAFGRKNFLGTFAPPFAVINDAAFLATLPERDLRAGIAEAVKVALIRDRDFFHHLSDDRDNLRRFAPDAMEAMIRRCAAIHLEHIATSGDPFESGSSRPLDFGHWSAHSLEELTGGELRHGEAVAIGIALDSLYSHAAGLLCELDLTRIVRLLDELGFKLRHPSLAWLDPKKALAGFREHLGGELSIPLLAGIGSCVDARSIDIQVMRSCIARLLELPHPADTVSESAQGPLLNTQTP